MLADARSALGGEDKLAAVKRLQVNGTTKRANGNFTLDGDTEMFFELPDKFRRNESLTIGGGGGGTGIDRKEILNGARVFRPRSAAATLAAAAVVASAGGGVQVAAGGAPQVAPTARDR